MKYALMLGLLMMAACSSEKDKPVVSTDPTFTVIFLDKSLSVHSNQAFINQKYQQAISALVDANINRKGDRLEVYFVHDNTAKARALNVTARSQMDEDEYRSASPTDREALESAFGLQIQRERSTIKQQILAKLMQENTSRSNQQTDLWASLAVLARANETGLNVKAYYLSDMVESSKGTGRRDFHVSPPANDQQADEWAKADAPKLKENTIGSPDITLVLPFEPNASRSVNNPAITRYWQTLFSELGVSNVAEE